MSKQGKLWEEPGFEPPVARYPAAFLSRPTVVPHLKKLKLEALKGINSTEIELEPPVTILTGPNNSGKSTILQAILLGFDVFRRCVDTSSWSIRSTGRATQEIDFLRVNEPKDLWFNQVWKPSKARERYIKVEFTFNNDFQFTARIRYLYGALNVGIENWNPEPSPDLVKAIVSSAPVLIAPSRGPEPHEQAYSVAQLHYTVGAGDPSIVLHNILWQLQNDDRNPESWEFVKDTIKRYFTVDLDKIIFDETFDLEIRVPYSETSYSLDIVSAGSGLNQILQLAAVIAWRKPGIVLVDEPDAHLHSTLQARVLDFLYELASHYDIQVIVATHSRDIISQAPLHTIIPVDLSREYLKPIASLEHLLLEFEREGCVSNIDIALLYQTKKCLFVEGPTDIKLLPKIAEELGLSMFKGRNQIVTFAFEGVENLKIIPKVVSLFERMIGANLSWGVLRDRDANLPEVIEEYRKEAKQSGIKNLYIWNSYSIENLLLHPNILVYALEKKYPDKSLSTEQIEELLEVATNSISNDVAALYIRKAQTSYRALNRDNSLDQGASDSVNFISSIITLKQKLQYYPGKKVFGQFVQLLQDKYGCNVRLDDLVKVINDNNAPSDFHELNQMLIKL